MNPEMVQIYEFARKFNSGKPHLVLLGTLIIITDHRLSQINQALLSCLGDLQPLLDSLPEECFVRKTFFISLYLFLFVNIYSSVDKFWSQKVCGHGRDS